jgi:hypothetical protein
MRAAITTPCVSAQQPTMSRPSSIPPNRIRRKVAKAEDSAAGTLDSDAHRIEGVGLRRSRSAQLLIRRPSGIFAIGDESRRLGRQGRKPFAHWLILENGATVVGRLRMMR